MLGRGVRSGCVAFLVVKFLRKKVLLRLRKIPRLLRKQASKNLDTISGLMCTSSCKQASYFLHLFLKHLFCVDFRIPHGGL